MARLATRNKKYKWWMKFFNPGKVEKYEDINQDDILSLFSVKYPEVKPFLQMEAPILKHIKDKRSHL